MAAESKDSPVKVAGYDITALLQALHGLDGIVKDVSNGQPIVRPFKIGGKTRVRLGKWLASVAEVNKTLVEARNALVKQFCAGKGPDGKNATTVPPEDMAAFNDEMKKALNEEHEFPHARVKIGDILNGDENEIPVTVLAGLAPILED